MGAFFRCVIIVVGSGIALMIGLAIVLPNAPSNPCNDADKAYSAGRAEMRSYLKAPASAEFSANHASVKKKVGDCEYQLTGWVDSQNSFGATLRSYWRMNVQHNGQKWERVGEITVE